MRRLNRQHSHGVKRDEPLGFWPERDGVRFARGALWGLALAVVLWGGLFALFSFFV